MGIESSQVQQQLETDNRGGRVFGPAMSPTPSDVEEGRVFGPSMSPLPSEDEIHLREPSPAKDRPKSPSNKKKKKKKKQKNGLGSNPVSHEAGPEVADGDADNSGEEAAALPTKKEKKKKSRKKQPAPQLELEPEDDAVIQNTQPEARSVDVEEPHQSPKRKSKKRSKKNATRDHPQENSTVGDGLLDGHALHQAGDNLHEDASRAEDTSLAPDLLQSPFQSMRRTGRKNVVDLPSSDAQRLLVSHVQGGSPPSAQHPPLNGISKYEPGLEEDADDESIVPSSQLNWERRPSTQSHASTIEPSQIKPEAPDDEDQLQFHFAGIAATSFADATRDPTAEVMREDDSPSRLPWLHKDSWEAANPPVSALDTRVDTNMDSDALPELLPSRIKMESVSRTGSNADPDSESDSPSAARLERLSTRSRSASRASAPRAGWLADQDLGPARSVRPAPRPVSRGADLSSPEDETPRIAPSSTGSNASIPARIEPDDMASHSAGSSRPHSRSRSRSSSSSVSSKSGRDDDRTHLEPMEAHLTGKRAKETSPSKRAEKANQATQKAAQPTTARDADVNENETPDIIGQGESTNTLLLRPQSDDEISSGDAHLVANSSSRSQGGIQSTETEAVDSVTPEVGAPADGVQAVDNDVELGRSPNRPKSARKRKAKASLALEIEEPVSLPATATEGEVEAGVSATAASPEKAIRQRIPRGNQESRGDSIEPGESASQPQLQMKGKKKRKLQQNTSLSLTQIEGDDETMEGPSRLSTFSQANNPPRGGSNEAEPSEIGASQEPTSTQTSRKTKRKRRNANDKSEDDMEVLLAAGAKTRKKGNKLGLDDDEDSRPAKRKRLQSKEQRATGAWTSEELGALGRVVEEFRDANGMTQHEVNKMIHEVPNKSDPVNQGFWNKADIAVPGRTRKQVVERARRLYHNFEGRGTWTEEQKAELHELLEQHGQKASYPWAEIAAAINRDPKDVRDYWRNHYLVFGTQVKSRWSKEDEERLKEVVEEALSKIRIMRENNDQLRAHPRAKAVDEEALLDWQQISTAMGLTRSRQQCKWKWTDLREKGLVGDSSIVLPTQPRSSAGASGSGKRLHGISDELANAREDYRSMSDEDKFRLVDAIYDSGALSDGRIRWAHLVDERFRVKWKRPTLKLVWYRLRRTVPDHENQNLEKNAQFLINYYRQNRRFPRILDNQVDEQTEEKLVRYAPGRRVWTKLSENSNAVRERQRRSSSANKRTNDQPRPKVSSELLRIEGSDEDEDAAGPSQDESVDPDDEEAHQRARRRRGSLEDVPIMIPNHLKEDGPNHLKKDEEILAAARAKARSKAKGRGKGKEPAKVSRSASVALDSDSE